MLPWCTQGDKSRGRNLNNTLCFIDDKCVDGGFAHETCCDDDVVVHVKIIFVAVYFWMFWDMPKMCCLQEKCCVEDNHFCHGETMATEAWISMNKCVSLVVLMAYHQPWYVWAAQMPRETLSMALLLAPVALLNGWNASNHSILSLPTTHIERRGRCTPK